MIQNRIHTSSLLAPLSTLLTVLSSFLISLWGFAGQTEDTEFALSAFAQTSQNSSYWQIYTDSNGQEVAPYEQVFELMEKTYKDIGFPHLEPSEFKKYSFIMAAKDRSTERFIAFCTFRKSRFGLRFGILGQDGSPPGKMMIKELLRKVGNTPGVYAELAEIPAAIALKSNARIVPLEEAQLVLEKPDIEPLETHEASKIFSQIESEELDLPNFALIQANGYKRHAVIDGKKALIYKILLGHPIHYPSS